MLSHNPRIVTDGLVLCLDAANPKSFRGEPTENLFTYPSGFNTTTGGVSVQQTEDNNIKNAYEIINSDEGNNNASAWFQFNDTYSANNTYTLSFKLKGGLFRNPTLRIGSLNLGNLSFSETPIRNYSLITITFTPSDDFNRVRIYFDVGTNIVGEMQLEEKPYPTPFVDGVRGATVETGGGWADLSKNTNHGELVNGVQFDNDNKGSLVFDGVDDSIVVNGAPAGISPVTVCGWFKKNSISVEYIINQFQSTGTSWGIRANSTSIRIFNDTSGVSNLTHFGTTISNNEWTHFAGGHKDDGFFLYINGELVGEGIDEGEGPSSVGGNLFIGQRGNNGSYFNGNISNVQVYNRALSPEEIRRNFQATRGRYGI